MRHLRFSSATRALPGRAAFRRAALKAVTALVVLGALGGSLSSCSTAPTAATVNGAEISQEQLAAELSTLSSDAAYVQQQDNLFADATAVISQATGQEQEAWTVGPQPGVGSGPGEYSTVWVSVVLSSMVQELALRQHLRKLGLAPTAAEVDAAWSSEDAANQAEWRGLSASERSDAALYDAQRSLVEGLSPLGPATSFYKSHVEYFWSQVCLAAVDVPATSTGLAAAKQQAEVVAKELEGQTVTGAQPVLGASLYCDTPEQLIEQPLSFQGSVGGLAPGQAVVLPISDGYQVVEVRSRTPVPFDSQVASVIGVVAA